MLLNLVSIASTAACSRPNKAARRHLPPAFVVEFLYIEHILRKPGVAARATPGWPSVADGRGQRPWKDGRRPTALEGWARHVKVPA